MPLQTPTHLKIAMSQRREEMKIALTQMHTKSLLDNNRPSKRANDREMFDTMKTMQAKEQMRATMLHLQMPRPDQTITGNERKRIATSYLHLQMQNI
jgi:hypothetical protein